MFPSAGFNEVASYRSCSAGLSVMTNDSLKDYFDKARRLDQDRLISAERSRRLSWFVAVVASAIAAFSRAAVAALTPLKTVEPFMIRVDNATGIIDVVSALTSTVGPMRRKSQNTRRPVCPGARRVCVERGGGEFSDGLAVVERGRTDPISAVTGVAILNRRRISMAAAPPPESPSSRFR